MDPGADQETTIRPIKYPKPHLAQNKGQNGPNQGQTQTLLQPEQPHIHSSITTCLIPAPLLASGA